MRGWWLAGIGAVLLPGPALAAVDGTAIPPVLALPFLGVLLSIALMPLLIGQVWHHHYGKIALGWALLLLLPFAALFGAGEAAGLVAHVALDEYLPFLLLLLALYTTGGGVVVRGSLSGSPAGNTALLAFGTAIASIMGTTGAAMVMIRPVMRANAHRKHKTHVFVFFIFLVANIGGGLTPLGDPPLYLGFLAGVPFFWPLQHLKGEVAFFAVALLAVFYALDSWYHRRDGIVRDPVPRQRLSVAGGVNLLLLALIVAMVLAQGVWRPGEVTLAGVHVPIERLVAMIAFVAIAAASMALTPAALREENGFAWGAMAEVAKLFAAIFVTMAPVLAMLRAGRDGPMGGFVALLSDGAGVPIPWIYFWGSGILSSFLDNAPTYLVFFNLAGGDPGALTTTGALALAAISCGAVFMGANSYIGNAPNFMVKAIVEESGFRMPSFFGYVGWACVFLVPVFVVVTLVFFR